MIALWAGVATVATVAAVTTDTPAFWIMAVGAGLATVAYSLGRRKRRQAQRRSH